MTASPVNVALVYNWPGSRNSELDLIGRIREILSRAGHASHVIDPFGQLLDDTGNYAVPRQKIDEQTLTFVLNLHYSNPKFLDTFSYFTNWNPIDYLRKDPATGNRILYEQEEYIANCMRTHDVALPAGSDVVNGYYQAINVNNPAYRNDETIIFLTTCPYFEGVNPVTLDQPRIFYIGINWERLASKEANNARHGGLLERLDDAGSTDFYGVSMLRNRKLWEGFRNYKGELPFDNGQSIISKSNQCGISLVLSSRSHHNSGLISTRIFQACAARTVIISDDNEFIKENFGDSVLYINFTDDTDSNYQQIQDTYNWIRLNPEQAKLKAEKAHEIFHSKFTLDRQVQNLLDYHALQTARRSSQPATAGRVEVFWIARNPSPEDVELFISNVTRQRGIRLLVTIVTGKQSEKLFAEKIKSCPNPEFRLYQEENLQQPDGYYLGKYIKQTETEGSLCLYTADTEWYSNHLATLQSALEAGRRLIAQSAACIKNEAWDRDYHVSAAMNSIKDTFSPVNILDILKLNYEKYCPSMFLVKKSLLNDGVMSVISNLHYAHWFVFLVADYMETSKAPLFIPQVTLRILKNNKSVTQEQSPDYLLALNADRRFMKLCYGFETEGREVMALGRELRREMKQMVSFASFRERLVNRCVKYFFKRT